LKSARDAYRTFFIVTCYLHNTGSDLRQHSTLCTLKLEFGWQTNTYSVNMFTRDADLTAVLRKRISFYVLNIVAFILWYKQNVRLHRNSELI